ncbi:hypothetical protein GALL_336570 [mine drainage metagenome]|uniref:DUF4862 domain-containing protein n=1 Tax=mine drainage metagenome TaxID=410659 RepID=A0A1J5QXL7_9ZZZZ
MKRFFLGAYATSPCETHWDAGAEAAYWAGLAALPSLGGLEYPFTGALHPYDEAWALAHLKPEWDLVLTLLPGTMDRLGQNPHFGLASDDAEGRAAALAFTGQARAVAQRFNEAAGRRRVVAVELHAAPRRGVAGVSASAAALAASLAELAAWDWQGATLCLEHCDAWFPGQTAIKGFLPLPEEIRAIRASGAPVGLALNWGRSVLEERDPAHVLDQIRAARAEGLLRGLIFSGCSGEETPWGVWQDSHMPHAPAFGVEHAAPGSLMTAEAMAQALEAAGEGLVFLGGKMTARPKGATLERRLGLNRDFLAVLERI